MPIYKEYASVYDASGQMSFSLRMIGYLERLLARHPVSGNSALDLACGTGTVAIALARAGWAVTGVDGSAEMLAQARRKGEGGDQRVAWDQQDMRLLRLPGRVHLATCLYDSLNYMLTSEDLLAVMRRVHGVLAPGGLFLFDMNTAYALATYWDDETYYTDTEALGVILQSSYEPQRQRTKVSVTCYVREGLLYSKSVEEHVEQAYPEEQVATLLADAGFLVEARYHCFTLQPPDAETSRIMWVARRRGTGADEALGQ